MEEALQLRTANPVSKEQSQGDQEENAAVVLKSMDGGLTPVVAVRWERKGRTHREG